MQRNTRLLSIVSSKVRSGLTNRSVLSSFVVVSIFNLVVTGAIFFSTIDLPANPQQTVDIMNIIRIGWLLHKPVSIVPQVMVEG